MVKAQITGSIIGFLVILIFVYLANLLYTLVTHRDVLAFEKTEVKASWSVWKSIILMSLGTAIIAVDTKLVLGALEATASPLSFSSFFPGITVLAVIGNAADYIAAILFARKNQMTTVDELNVGSTI